MELPELHVANESANREAYYAQGELHPRNSAVPLTILRLMIIGSYAPHLGNKLVGARSPWTRGGAV